MPEVAVTVNVYVPAGVPVVVLVAVCEPHPGCRKIRTKNAPIITPRKARRLRDIVPPMPNPRKARPETGSHIA